MIIVQAVMWPNGKQLDSYEILNATITNQSPPDGDRNYYAHVLTRPKPFDGIKGYQAEIEVHGHDFRAGFAPLLMAVLGSAHTDDLHEGVVLPATRRLARVDLVEPHDFEAMLRRGVGR